MNYIVQLKYEKCKTPYSSKAKNVGIERTKSWTRETRQDILIKLILPKKVRIQLGYIGCVKAVSTRKSHTNDY